MMIYKEKKQIYRGRGGKTEKKVKFLLYFGKKLLFWKKRWRGKNIIFWIIYTSLGGGEVDEHSGEENKDFKKNCEENHVVGNFIYP